MKTEQYDEILVLTNDEDRKCAKCGRELPLSHFNRKGDGYQPYCKACQQTYARRWRLSRWARRQNILECYTLADIIEDFHDAGKGDKAQYITILESTVSKLKKINEDERLYRSDRNPGRIKRHRAEDHSSMDQGQAQD